MKKKIKYRRIIILISIFILLNLSGAAWQAVSVSVEKKIYTPIGQYIDVETYLAHYYSQGDGDVAFVFITGSGTPNSYTDFYNLQNKLSTIGKTVTFDHAGSGWSENTESERSIKNLVNELSIIIDTVVPGKPVVLLCHSLGSLEVIGYTQAHPDRVAGIVFLDSGSPEFYSRDSEFIAKIINRASALIRSVGVNRLLGELGLLLPLYGENIRNQKLNADLRDLDKAMYYQYAGNSSSLNVISLINENASVVLSGTSLGAIPILILSSDSGYEWKEVQMQLASWSENSKQITIKDSEHYLHWSNYDEVEDYIDSFIKENFK